jgi:hypothetical protein
MNRTIAARVRLGQRMAEWPCRRSREQSLVDCGMSLVDLLLNNASIRNDRHTPTSVLRYRMPAD